jgi:hypothetical protein
MLVKIIESLVAYTLRFCQFAPDPKIGIKWILEHLEKLPFWLGYLLL